MAKDLRRRVISLVKELRPEAATAAQTGTAVLTADLGFDSFSLMALAVRLHEELGADLAELAQRAPDVQTVDDLVNTMEALAHAGR